MTRHLPHYIAVLMMALVATPAVAQDGLPRFVQKAMKKEARKVKYQEVSVLDGQFTFNLPGKIRQSDAFDSGWFFEIDIKAGAPLECYLFNDNIDIAALMSNLSDINIEANAEANGKPLAEKRVYELDAGHIDGSPYLSLEWLFTLGDGGEVVGYTKSRAANIGDITLACSHNYFGYHKTFADIFEKFVSTAQVPPEGLPPHFEEIVIERINGQNVGFSYVSHARDAEGDSRVLTTRATIYPAGPGDVSTSDSASSIWTTPDGDVINGYSADSENGELINNMQLGRDEDGNWNSYGMFQGKDIDYVIDGNLDPSSDLTQRRLITAMFDSEDTQTEMLVWVPSADPTTFINGIIEQTGEDRQARMILGPVEFDGRFDEQGSLTEAVIEAGASTLELERIWVNGEL